MSSSAARFLQSELRMPLLLSCIVRTLHMHSCFNTNANILIKWTHQLGFTESRQLKIQILLNYVLHVLPYHITELNNIRSWFYKIIITVWKIFDLHWWTPKRLAEKSLKQSLNRYICDILSYYNSIMWWVSSMNTEH